MSSIKQRIDSDLKIALLAGKKDQVSTLRGLKSVILNAEIAGNKREEGLSDEDLVSLLNKELKKRQESAEMYARGGRQGRADQELAEKTLINSYLPTPLSDNELLKLVEAAMSEDKATGIKDMSKVIAMVKEGSGGRADGSRIAQLVKDKLQ